MPKAINSLIAFKLTIEGFLAVFIYNINFTLIAKKARCK